MIIMKCKICFKHELVRQEQDSFSSEQEFICPSCDGEDSEQYAVRMNHSWTQ